MPYFGNNPSPLLLNTVAQNGKEMTLDADADTSITADTDDQIDIKIGGADDFQFTANTFTAQSGSTIATNTISETTSGSGVTIDSVLLKDGGIDVNGNEIILDADADTSITADTDDQIDIKIAGADDFAFKANTFEVQTGSNIDMNGTELILDADGDSSITADTDDQIDIKVGGTDTVVISADALEVKGPHPSFSLTDSDDNNYGGVFYNNGAVTLAADHGATGATGTITFQIDGSTKASINSSGDLSISTDGASLKFGADSEMVLSHSHNEGLKLLTTAASGSLLTLGTTSTSVSDEAFIGGIDFASGSSPTVQARVQGKQEGTAEVGGHLSFETRASGGSLSERLKIDSIGRILATTTGARSIIGRGAYTGITVDNGSTTSVSGNNGVLFNMVMVSTGGGFGAVYSMAYNSTVNLIHGTGNFSSSSGTSSSTNVYKSSGSHAVTLQNNTGSAVTYYVLVLTSYD